MDLLLPSPRASVPPSSVLGSNLFIPTSPPGSQCTRPRTETDAAALLLRCLCVGPVRWQPKAFIEE